MSRINLFPPGFRPSMMIREGKFVLAWRKFYGAPWARSWIALAAFLVWLVRYPLFYTLVIVLLVGLLPVWILFGLGYVTHYYCLPIRWCVVVECAPEEIAAVRQALWDQEEPKERWTWRQAVRRQPIVDTGRGEFNTVTAHDLADIHGGEYPYIGYWGGKLTMERKAQELRRLQIPCRVVRLTLSASRRALLVRPETFSV